MSFKLLPSGGVKILAFPHQPPTPDSNDSDISGHTFTCSTHKSILGEGQEAITSKALSE